MPVKFNFRNPKMQGWMLLHQTFNSIAKCEDKELGEEGITPQQHAILMAIKLSDKPPSLTRIADWVDRHVNSITLIVDRMEKNGLVKRVRSTKDRRSFSLIMTEKGEKYLKTGVGTGNVLIQEIMSCLSNKELQAFIEFLDKIRHTAIKYCDENKPLIEIEVSKKVDL